MSKQEHCIATCKRIKLDHFLIPYKNVSLKWIISLNVRVKTTKLLGENVGVNLCDFGLQKGILDKTQKAQANFSR